MSETRTKEQIKKDNEELLANYEDTFMDKVFDVVDWFRDLHIHKYETKNITHNYMGFSENMGEFKKCSICGKTK